jgi:hypothetical protein
LPSSRSPRSTRTFEIRDDGRDVNEDFLIRDLNEWDDFSLEEAVKIKEASAEPVEVVVVTVAPDAADEALRKCLAKGADRAIRVWDPSVEGSDPLAIARILAAVARAESRTWCSPACSPPIRLIRVHRHRGGGVSRLAARRGGELAQLFARGEDRRVPP